MSKPPINRCDRKFHWISSSYGDPEILESLNEQMKWFYGQEEGRKIYQSMLNTQESISPPPGSVINLVLNYICRLNPSEILEIGCSTGYSYQLLRDYQYTGNYSGIEVADYIIQQNKQIYPEATWKCATTYETSFADESFDICFSLLCA